METWILIALIGAAAGLLAGLFGIGGGLIIVPALALLLPLLGAPDAEVMHLAVGTSLAIITLTSLASAASHQRKGAVDWALFGRVAPGLAAGAVLGAVVAGTLHSDLLARFFGVFALFMGFYIVWDPHPPRAEPRPLRAWLPAAGGLLGVLPAVLGIGGGLLLVPFFLWRGLKPVRAVATSSACTVPVGLAGALGYLFTGYGRPDLPAGTIGYIHWPALLGMAVLSMLFAPLGAYVAHRLSRRHLRRAFAVLVAGVGVWMLAAP